MFFERHMLSTVKPMVLYRGFQLYLYIFAAMPMLAEVYWIDCHHTESPAVPA